MNEALNDMRPAAKLLNISGKLVSLDEPKIMGILNLTPDSFYDGGTYNDHDKAIQRVGMMMSEGMDFLDIGAVSTRPGAGEVSEEEELSRLIPVIQKVHQRFPDLPVSVDTFRSRVAKEAVAAGASMVNDISAGEADKQMIAVVAGLKVPFIAMHKQGDPATMQANPVYDHVVHDILAYFSRRIQLFRESGINDIILDPGFGFGKNLEHNYRLLKGLDRFQICGLPILVGISRKSMICKALKVNPDKALNGTTAAHMIALARGADILRVHDVKEAREAVSIFLNHERAIL